jgi:GYF domain 2
MSDEQWYALESGQQRGPFSRSELANRLADGAPVALVWRDGMTGWVPPQDVAELAGWEDDEPAPPAFEEAFRAVARAYGATVHTSGRSHRFETMQADLTVRVSCDVGSRGEEATLEIERRGVRYPELTIRREGDLDRAGKRLGIDREAQMGDEALDRAAYFETALPAAAVRGIVGRPGFRRPLDRWLSRGADQVRLDEDGLAVRLPLKRADALTPALLEAELAAVAEAADALRGLDPGLERHRQATWPVWLAVFGILGALVGVPGALIAHALWEPVSIAPVLIGIAGGALLSAAIVAVMVFLLRGQSGVFRQIVSVGVTLLFALPSLGAAGMLAANGAFDRGPEQVHDTVVRSQTTEHDRRVASYFFGRARYRTRHLLETVEGTRVRRVAVAQQAWSGTRVGAPFRIRLRPGALGWEWDARPE